MTLPTIAFGSEQPFGALTGWNYTSANVTIQQDRANALDNDGDEAASKLYNERTEATASLTAASATGSYTIPEVGDLVGSYLITSIQISTTRDGFATMNLTGHQHTANAHDGTEKVSTHGITLTAGFGAQDFMGITVGSNAALRAGSITIECQHVDEMDADGDHLIGQNYNGMMTAETELTGVPETPTASGWDITSKPNPTGNTEFESYTVSGTKALTLANPA